MSLEEQEEILRRYRKDRQSMLSSLVGKNIRVRPLLVDRKRRQFVLSELEKDENDKATKLMETLKMGDIVKCKVRQMMSYGVFVEVEGGGEAFIHISELAWNRPTSPDSILILDQEIEAKVIELNFLRRRIYLSLKQMQSDPLLETLDSLLESDVTERTTGGSDLVSSLLPVLSRLRSDVTINSVDLGRTLRGGAQAPALQVYLSGQLENGYKLLARAGPEVQEILVTTSLDRASMKEAIQLAMMVEE